MSTNEVTFSGQREAADEAGGLPWYPRTCACCFKALGSSFVEYLYKLYHAECFRCHVCQKNFSSTPSSSSSPPQSEEAMSIVINRLGQLVCLKDYIE